MVATVATRVGSYQAWLRRDAASHPLVGLVWEPDIPPLPEFLELVGLGEEVRPEHVDPELFLPFVESWYRQASTLPGDIIQPFAPAFGIPWVEAIAGCRVVAQSGSLWAEPPLGSRGAAPAIRFDPGNPWLIRLLELTRAMADLAGGRFPIALPQLRGPLDTLAALRTPQGMSLDLVEDPAAARRLLSELTDLWIGVAAAVLDVVPPFHGGYASRMKMWAPGKTVTMQNDISTLISPRMYRELVLPLDRRICASFPYQCFHMHASEHHQIGNLLTIEGLSCIQLTLEHTLGGPPLEVMLPEVRRILESKPLLLAVLDLDTAERCLAELPPAGLAVLMACSDYQIPPEYRAWLSQHCVA